MLKERLGTCARQAMLTKGLPITGLIIGSLYFARSRLPESLRFIKNGWLFYSLIGVGGITASTVFGASTCTNTVVRPVLAELYQKYHTQDPGTGRTYDELRRLHREQHVDDEQQPLKQKQPFIFDEPTFISGTPMGESRNSSSFSEPAEQEQGRDTSRWTM
ncbi:Protein F48C1.6 [Aphelenchoides avenae]|nr:Protein F48C1.6 [Aphelenchus avenae]